MALFICIYDINNIYLHYNIYDMRIKDILTEKGMTMAELAKKANMHQPEISRAINGNPTIATLNKIAAALGVDIVDLFEKREEVRVFVEHQGERREITAKDIIRLMEVPKMPDEKTE